MVSARVSLPVVMVSSRRQRGNAHLAAEATRSSRMAILDNVVIGCLLHPRCRWAMEEVCAKERRDSRKWDGGLGWRCRGSIIDEQGPAPDLEDGSRDPAIAKSPLTCNEGSTLSGDADLAPTFTHDTDHSLFNARQRHPAVLFTWQRNPNFETWVLIAFLYTRWNK